MFCTNCGNQVSEGKNFCGFCGAKINGDGEKRTPDILLGETEHETVKAKRSRYYLIWGFIGLVVIVGIAGIYVARQTNFADRAAEVVEEHTPKPQLTRDMVSLAYYDEETVHGKVPSTLMVGNTSIETGLEPDWTLGFEDFKIIDIDKNDDQQEIALCYFSGSKYTYWIELFSYKDGELSKLKGSINCSAFADYTMISKGDNLLKVLDWQRGVGQLFFYRDYAFSDGKLVEVSQGKEERALYAEDDGGLAKPIMFMNDRLDVYEDRACSKKAYTVSPKESFIILSVSLNNAYWRVQLEDGKIGFVPLNVEEEGDLFTLRQEMEEYNEERGFFFGGGMIGSMLIVPPSEIKVNPSEEEEVDYAKQEGTLTVEERSMPFPSEVPEDKKLRNKYYVVSDPDDPIVGTWWYGFGNYDEEGAYTWSDRYMYISKVGPNKYQCIEQDPNPMSIGSIREDGEVYTVRAEFRKKFLGYNVHNNNGYSPLCFDGGETGYCITYDSNWEPYETASHLADDMYYHFTFENNKTTLLEFFAAGGIEGIPLTEYAQVGTWKKY